MPFILLVDDNPDDAELLVHALKSTESGTQEIVVAKNGAEASDILFKSAREVPTLILLDINMPVMNGMELLKQIRSQSRTKLVPVVIYTSSDKPGDIKQAYTLGANSFVLKTGNYDEGRSAMLQIAEYWLRLNRVDPG